MYLHDPSSQRHLDALKHRLSAGPGPASPEPGDVAGTAAVDRLIDVVRAMDAGRITARDALAIYGVHRIPGFSFGPWLVEMVDQGVYRAEIYDEAA